jgi:hypothetical protein
MPKRIREDAERWRNLLAGRGVRRLWHFTPLVCIPCILHHGKILSIEQQERMRLAVPPRASRDDDVRKGVGNDVKLSVMPYWKMLSGLMRNGGVETMLEFRIDPVLWDDTHFGNSNVWEGCWEKGSTFDFADTKVFVPRSRWDGGSPPEIYVSAELPIEANLVKVYTVLEQERMELKDALQRLGLQGIDVFSAGFSHPFPDAGREEYLSRHPEVFERVKRYLQRVTRESLDKGVELERFDQ